MGLLSTESELKISSIDVEPPLGLEDMSSTEMRRPLELEDSGLSFAGSRNGFRDTGRPLLEDDDGAGSRKGEVGLGTAGETARRKGLLEASCGSRPESDK
jgi:hypothetical protein